MPALPTTQATATVTITGTVVDVLTSTDPTPADRFTQATVALQANPPPGITQSADGTLVVTAAIMLNYVFADTTIRPIGIAFEADHIPGGGGSGIGNNNMPYADIRLLAASGSTGATIQVPDLYVSNVVSHGASWEYYLVFQTTTGAIGIIDPEVENDDPNR